MSHQTITTVESHNPEYDEILVDWQQMRDNIAGERAIKEATTTYLPPINANDTADSPEYKNYIASAEFYNATGLTRDAFSGMIFRKEPTISEAVPEDMQMNIDAEGTPISTFSEEVTDQVIDVGRVLLVGDLPDMSTAGLTVSESEALGFTNPFIKMYIAESFINWKHQIIMGVKIPVLAVVVEIKESLDDIFTHDVTEEQFRVFRITGVEQSFELSRQRNLSVIIDDDMLPKGIYVQELYNDSGERVSQVVPIFNGKPLTELPVQVIGPDNLDFDVSKPPLLDLSNTNLAHYRKSADLNAALRMFGKSTPVFGIDQSLVDDFKKEPISFGSSVNIILPMSKEGPEPFATFLEPEGNFQALTENITTLEDRMAAQGARMLQPQKRGVESAESVRLDMIGETSIMGSIALNVSRGISIILQLLTGNPDASITLNTDFLAFPIDAQKITSLLSALQAGTITHKQFMHPLIRGEAVIPIEDAESVEVPEEELTDDEIEIEEEPQELPGGGTMQPSSTTIVP